MKRMVLLCVAVLLFAFPPSASSTLINGGFEAGDFTGWSQNVPTGGEAGVATGHSGSSGTIYLPVEGQYFALLKTDGPDNYTTISQSIDLLAGDVLTGWAAFDYSDYSPYNDNAYVHIVDDTGTVVATPWDEYGTDHESYWDGPWTFWNFTPPQAGNYQIEFGVANNLVSCPRNKG